MDAAAQPRWVALRALAASQHGLATHRQLEDVGFPRSTVARLVVGGQLIRVASGVLALPGGQQTDLQRAAAAVLGHEHAAITGWSAAWL